MLPFGMANAAFGGFAFTPGDHVVTEGLAPLNGL